MPEELIQPLYIIGLGIALMVITRKLFRVEIALVLYFGIGCTILALLMLDY